jgi:hypothetical protein
MAIVPQISAELLSTTNPGMLTEMLRNKMITNERIAASEASRALLGTQNETAQFTLREAINAAQREQEARGMLAQMIGGDMGAAFGASPELAAQGQTFQYNEKLIPLNLEGKKLSNLDTADTTRSRGFNDRLAQNEDGRQTQALQFRMQQAQQAQAMQEQAMLQQAEQNAYMQMGQEQEMALLQQRDTMNKLIKAGEIALDSPAQWGDIREVIQNQTGAQLPEEFNAAWINDNVNKLRNQLSIMDAGQPQKLKEIKSDNTYIDERTGQVVFSPTISNTIKPPKRVAGDWYETDIELSDGDKALVKKRLAGINRVRNIINEMRNTVQDKGGSFSLSKTAAKMNTLNKNFQNALKEAEGMGALQLAEIQQMEKMVPDTVGIAPNLLNTRKGSWVQAYNTMVEQLDNNINTLMDVNGLVKLNKTKTGNNTGGAQISSVPQERLETDIQLSIPRTVETAEEALQLPIGSSFIIRSTGQTGTVQ